MKRKTALWKMKQAMSKWGPSTEFWQEVKEILRDFETDMEEKYKPPIHD